MTNDNGFLVPRARCARPGFVRLALILGIASTLMGCIANSGDGDEADAEGDGTVDSLTEGVKEARRSKLIDGRYTLTAHEPRDGFSPSNPNFGPYANASVACVSAHDCDDVVVEACLRRQTSDGWSKFVCSSDDTVDGDYRRWAGVWSTSTKESKYQSRAILKKSGKEIGRIDSHPSMLKSSKK